MPGAVFGFPPPYFLRPPGQFIDRAGTVTVAPSSSGVAVSLQVPARQVLIVMAIGFDGGQLTNVIWGTWALYVTGLPDPEFNNIQGMISRVLEPAPYYRLCGPESSVELRVQNTNSTQTFGYTGRIIGYTQSEDYAYGADIMQGSNLRAGV